MSGYINPSDITNSLADSMSRLSGVFGAFRDRLDEADRVSQYSSGLAAMDRAFSQYDRELKDKRWARPRSSDETSGTVDPSAAGAGADAQLTIGQIDETSLAADHEAMVKAQRDFIMQNTRHKKAQEQLLQALDQRSVQNYDQVANLWGTYKTHELIATSDRNINYYSQKAISPEQKMTAITAQLQADVQNGLRFADDAAIYREKMQDQVQSSWADAAALDQAKAAGWDTTVSDAWLDANTPFWNLDPAKREAAKNVVRQQAAFQRSEVNRLDGEYDDRAEAAIQTQYHDSIDSLESLRKIRDVLPQTNFRDGARLERWTDKLTNRIEYLERTERPVDKPTYDDWQKSNYNRLLTQLVQAKADGVQPKELRSMIDEYNVIPDGQGKVADYRLAGPDLQKVYRDFVDESTSEATTAATKWIRAYAKEKKLAPTSEEDLVAQFWKLYQTHPDASEEEMRKAADAIAQPIVKQNLAKLFDKIGVQALFGDDRVMTVQEQALYDIQERGFTWRSTEPQNLAYLQELAAKWLKVAQDRFPAERLTRAEPDVQGYYGMEGIPLLYSEEGALYRWIVEGKQAELQRFVRQRGGQRAWETVSGPLPPKPAPSASPRAASADVSALQAQLSEQQGKLAELDRQGSFIAESDKETVRRAIRDITAKIEQLGGTPAATRPPPGTGIR